MKRGSKSQAAVALPQIGSPWMGAQDTLDQHNAVLLNLAALDPMELALMQTKKVELFASLASAQNQYHDHYMINSYADGKLATLSITGSLMNHPLPLRMFGLNVTTYGEIQAALQQLRADPKVEEIMLLVESAGGGSMGLFRTSNFLERVGKEKRLSTFSSSVMGSAAYYLGVNSPNIGAEPMANIGSVGVYAIMTSNVEEMRKEGVEQRVIRAGEFKALGISAEPISEKAVAEWQRNISATYDAFLDHASSKRGMDREIFRTQAAEGREFLGTEAAAVGLVDDVMVFDEYLELRASAISKSGSTVSVPGKQVKMEGPDMKKMLALLKKAGVELTAQQSAALASGAPLESLGLDAKLTAELEAARAEGDDDEGNDGAGGEDDPDKPKGDEGGDGGEDDQDKPKDEPKLKGTDTGADFGQMMTQMLGLQTDKTKLEAQVASLTAQLASAREKASADADTITALCAISGTAIGRMETALRASSTELKDFTPAQIIALHTTVQEQFLNVFPVGRKTKPVVKESVKGHERQGPDAIATAAQSATKI